jgi:signal peptidase
MERVRKILKWKQRSELVKTGILMLLVAGATFGGYGLFMLAMGTTTPLVVVTSESMEPTFYRGDLAVIQGKAADQVRLGDIVVYSDTTYMPGTSIIHRVISIDIVNGTYYYYTKGDHNPTQDPGTRTYSEIVGVVVFVIPQLGNVSLFLRTPLGLLLIVVLFLAILFVPEAACRKKEEPEREAQAVKPGQSQSLVKQDSSTAAAHSLSCHRSI